MQQFPFKAAAAVSGVLGALALLLTAIGLHGVVSYSVQQRRREMGILLALGARPVQLIRRILGEPARWLVAGLATGLPCCLWLSWFAASSIFAALPVRVFDSSAYVAVAALLAAAAVAACVAPVRRALRADPMTALRQD